MRRTRGEKIYNVFNILFFVVFAFICVYPFYYLIINSISDNAASAAGQVNWWPDGFHLENYKQVFALDGLSTAAFISLARTVIGTALTVIASAFLGFMFTQQKMWRRTFWYRFIVVTMYFNAGLIPMFITMKNLGLTNNFWVYVLPAIVQPFNIILVKTYVESIPAIFSAVGQWNSFQDTLIYMTDSKLYSLQYLLYTYINQANALAASVKASAGTAMNVAALATQQTPTSIRMTVSVIVVLPILFVYPFFQRFFVKGMMLGAVKG